MLAARSRALPSMRRAYAMCFVTVVTALACAALMTAAALVPAPPSVLPLAVVVCIGCPMAMALSLPRSMAILRALRSIQREEDSAVGALRSHLARLPETEHPLGL